MKDFSFLNRGKIKAELSHAQFDLIIIGGGITGAGIALDAASRGLKTALVEKNDFAFGTSSRSTKLIHGGLRYLKQFEFGLVKEVGSERAILHKLGFPSNLLRLPDALPRKSPGGSVPVHRLGDRFGVGAEGRVELFCCVSGELTRAPRGVARSAAARRARRR